MKFNKSELDVILEIMNDGDKIVTLESYYDPMLAEIVKGRLEAEGIPCYIADANISRLNPIYNQAIGGVKLRVFERDLEKSYKILSDEVDMEPSEPDEQSDGQTLCPFCKSANTRYGAATKQKASLLGIVMSFVFMLYPFQARKAWHCFNCGNDFK